MIKIKHRGKFEKTTRFFNKMSRFEIYRYLKKCGEDGVKALSDATPKDSGRTSESWSYDIRRNGDSYTIEWSNSNVNRGVNVAIILQYGHGTRNGGYVKGINYINPALKPIFDKLADEVWKEVKGA